jgi:serine/threonine protein kinase
MGSVYLASNGSSLAAVKVISPALADDPAFRQRFRREVDICRLVTGPQVAELIDAGPDDAQPWLAIRYIPGPTLREAVTNHGPLVGETLRGFAVAAAEALRQIHAAGVVHRDLKPSNVILTPETPVIIDFGIAGVTEATSLTATGAVLGSAGWMAPEQVLGEPSGPPSDVFAWAAVVAYAATGRPPFGLGRPEALTYRIVHGDADLEGIDADLEPLIRRALARAPAERPTVPELLSALAGSADATRVAADIATAWVSDESTAISEPPTTAVPLQLEPPKRRRKPTLLGAATAAVLIALVAGVVLFVQRQPPGDSAAEPEASSLVSSGAKAEATTTDPPATTTTTEPPATTAPPAPASIRDTDLRNRSYDIFCDGSGAVTTIEVTDGTWTSPTGPEDGSLNNFEIQYGDVTGDGVEDAFVNMDCSVGMGSNAWGNTVVLEPAADGVRQVGQPIPSRTWLVDGKLIGETLYREESDPMCCPSSIDQSTWILRNGGWSQESTTRIPADESLTYAGE